MKKRISVLLLVFVMTVCTIPAIQQAHAESTLQIGDYVYFGCYNGNPILWRIINKNTDGSFMIFSEYVLCEKAFDAYGDITNPSDDDGSSNWEKSNIREWLNSDGKTVKYSSQKPDKNHVKGGEYDTEPGFLYNFNQAERNSIQPVKHKSLLSNADSKIKEGGTEKYKSGNFSESISIPEGISNYDKVFYKMLTDKVFFLDIKELYDFVYKRGWSCGKTSTKGNAEYWLRTPVNEWGCLSVLSNGQLILVGVSSGDDFGGVAPALNLKPGMEIVKGTGSDMDPYCFNTQSTSIALNGPSIVELQKGESKSLGITIEPVGPSISYTSSNTSVATVSKDGTITAVNKGTAEISIKASGQRYYEAEKKVTVFVSQAGFKYSFYNVNGLYSDNITSIIWDGKKYTASLLGGFVYSSSDGLMWKQSGLFIPKEEYESNNGPNAQRADDMIYANNMYMSMAFCTGSGSSDTPGRVLSSQDGVTWHVSLLGQRGKDLIHFQDIKYINNTFYVLGSYVKSGPGSYYVLYSSADGKKWKETIMKNFAYDFFGDLAYNGKKYISVGPNYYNIIGISDNMLQWTKLNMNQKHKFKKDDKVLHAASNGKNFVIITFDGEIITSADGVTWKTALNKDAGFCEVKWTGSEYIVTGYNSGKDKDGFALFSKDGSKWEEIVFGKDINNISINACNDRILFTAIYGNRSMGEEYLLITLDRKTGSPTPN